MDHVELKSASPVKRESGLRRGVRLGAKGIFTLFTVLDLVGFVILLAIAAYLFVGWFLEFLGFA